MLLPTRLRRARRYFIDGGVPSEQIIRQFLELSEADPGLIAVHCKAGLGRTGTLIAMYLMKHYGFTSAEVIGYLRIMRPGSVLGPQQFFLKQWERPMWAQGEAHRRGAPIQPYSGDSGYGKPASASPKSAGGASGFSDSPVTRPMGASSPVQQAAKKSPSNSPTVLGSSLAAPATTSSPSLAASASALPRQLLPGISTSKTSGSLTSSLGSMMLSAAGSPSSYSPTGSRPAGPSPLVRSASFQPRSVAAFLSRNVARSCFC
jgi:hypothetical protein